MRSIKSIRYDYVIANEAIYIPSRRRELMDPDHSIVESIVGITASLALHLRFFARSARHFFSLRNSGDRMGLVSVNCWISRFLFSALNRVVVGIHIFLSGISRLIIGYGINY